MKATLVTALFTILNSNAALAITLPVHYVCSISHTSIGPYLEYELDESGMEVMTGEIQAESFSGSQRDIEIKGDANSMHPLIASGTLANNEGESPKNYQIGLLVGTDDRTKTPRVTIMAEIFGIHEEVIVEGKKTTLIKGSQHKLVVNGLSTQAKVNGKYESSSNTSLSVYCENKSAP